MGEVTTDAPREIRKVSEEEKATNAPPPEESNSPGNHPDTEMSVRKPSGLIANAPAPELDHKP